MPVLHAMLLPSYRPGGIRGGGSGKGKGGGRNASAWTWSYCFALVGVSFPSPIGINVGKMSDRRRTVRSVWPVPACATPLNGAFGTVRAKDRRSKSVPGPPIWVTGPMTLPKIDKQTNDQKQNNFLVLNKNKFPCTVYL